MGKSHTHRWLFLQLHPQERHMLVYQCGCGKQAQADAKQPAPPITHYKEYRP